MISKTAQRGVAQVRQEGHRAKEERRERRGTKREERKRGEETDGVFGDGSVFDDVSEQLARRELIPDIGDE